MKGFISIMLGIAIAIIAIVSSAWYVNSRIEGVKKLGATADTQLTDTVNTFRLNLNSLNTEYHASTSTDPGHIHTLFASTTITNASTTNITATGYGLFTSLFFTNATGTNTTFTGVVSSSQSYLASSTNQGTSTFNSTLIFGQGSSTVQCVQTYVRGTTTIFYIGVNTSTYTLFATSTKPNSLCN